MEIKRQELQQLLEKHEALLRKADDKLVKVYARMKPDAAAGQLVGLDEEVAAALLFRLDPKNASAILNEMSASRGAALIKKFSTLTSIPRNGKQP